MAIYVVYAGNQDVWIYDWGRDALLPDFLILLPILRRCGRQIAGGFASSSQRGQTRPRPICTGQRADGKR